MKIREKFELISYRLTTLKSKMNAQNWMEDKYEIITYEDWFPSDLIKELIKWFGKQFKKEKERLFLDRTCNIKFHQHDSRGIKRQFLINKHSCIKICDMEAYFGSVEMDKDSSIDDIIPVPEPVQSSNLSLFKMHGQDTLAQVHNIQKQSSNMTPTPPLRPTLLSRTTATSYQELNVRQQQRIHKALSEPVRTCINDRVVLSENIKHTDILLHLAEQRYFRCEEWLDTQQLKALMSQPRTKLIARTETVTREEAQLPNKVLVNSANRDALIQLVTAHGLVQEGDGLRSKNYLRKLLLEFSACRIAAGTPVLYTIPVVN